MGSDNSKFKVLEYGNGSLYKLKNSSKESIYYWKVNGSQTYNLCEVNVTSVSDTKIPENIIVIHDCAKCKDSYDEFLLPKSENQCNFIFFKYSDLSFAFKLKYKNINFNNIKIYSISFGMISFSFPVYIIYADTCEVKY